MKFLPELGVIGNIERAMSELKNQKNKSIEFDSNLNAERERTDRIKETNSIAFVTLAELGNIDEVTASEHTDVFPCYHTNIKYFAGNIFQHENKLYKVLQNHTSQTEWAPESTPSLYKRIGDPTEEYPQWVQPISAGDEYNTGDKVTDDNKHWRSTIDNNVWEPGVYGWEEVD